MKTTNHKVLGVVAVASLLAASGAQATNGYFQHGYSTKEKGLVGAGVALSQDAMASATNPAGMAFVGERMDAGLQLFSPSPRSYTVTGAPSGAPGTFGLAPEKVESENDYFLIPSFAYNMALDSMSSIGVSVYGNGGMNTEYAPTAANGNQGTFGEGTAGVNLAQLFVNASYARKIDDKQAWGASLIFAYQRFAASGLGNFAPFSLDSGNLTGNRNSYSSGFGFKLGYQGEIMPRMRFGMSYQSEMSMGEFDEYAGLFAEQGGFDIPATAIVGVSYDISNKSTLLFDIQKIWYSDVPSISNPISNLTGTGGPPATGGCAQGVASNCLGGANGGGFGWEDMTIVKLGYQWQQGNNTLRVGISHGDQPIPESEVMFNILATAVVETHLTFGMTMPMGSNQEFNFAAMYALENDVSGPNPMEAPGQQTIKLEMSQIDLQAGWAWKY